MRHYQYLHLYSHYFNVHAIFDYLSKYGYGFIFLGTIFEGELVLLTAGFLAYLGVLNFWLVLFVGFIGATLGDNIWYHVGQSGGIPLIENYGRWFFLTPRRVKRAAKYFEAHGGKTIFFSRFVFGTRISTAILAGALKMPREKFFKSNVLGAGVWAIITTTLGYLFGNSFELLRHYVQRSETALLILACAAAIILLLRFLFNRLDA